MVLMKKTTQHLRYTGRSSRGSYIASTLIQDLQGLGQLATISINLQLFKLFEFGNGSRMSDKNLVILEFKYLQNKIW